MPINDKTGQSKRFAFIPAQIMCDELLKLNETNLNGSQIKIEKTKSTRRQEIIVSSPTKIQPVGGNNHLGKQSTLQISPLVFEK